MPLRRSPTPRSPPWRFIRCPRNSTVAAAYTSKAPVHSHALSQLITQTTASAPTAAKVGSGEALYRMVVAAKVAAQFGKGLISSMTSKAGEFTARSLARPG